MLLIRINFLSAGVSVTLCARNDQHETKASQSDHGGGGARLLGIEEQLGTLEPGKIADIVAVRNNAPEDMRTIESVFFAMKEGRVIRDNREALR